MFDSEVTETQVKVSKIGDTRRESKVMKGIKKSVRKMLRDSAV